MLKDNRSYPPLGKSTGIGEETARELAGPPAAMEEVEKHCSFEVRQIGILRSFLFCSSPQEGVIALVSSLFIRTLKHSHILGYGRSG